MKKKLVLMISIVILILVASLVSSVAFFSGLINGEKVISVKTGDLTFKYTEVSGIGNGINLIDTEPISDSEGKKLDNYFDFKVDGKLTRSGIKYDINLELLENSTTNLEGIKVYLTELVDGEEKEIEDNIDELGNVKTLSDYQDLVIYHESIPRNTKDYEKNFRLRVWIDEDTDIYSDGYIGTSIGFKVNVNAKTDINDVAEDQITDNDTRILRVEANNSYIFREAVEENIDYEISVPYTVEEIDINVVTENTNSVVEVEKIGIEQLSTKERLTVGDNYFKAKVTSSNGNKTQKYNLKVTRIDLPVDTVTLEGKEEEYTGEPIKANEATSLIGSKITYKYYNSVDCSGEEISIPVNPGNYSVKAISSGKENEYHQGSICVTHTILKNTNNNLKSLGVEGYTLNEEFSKDRTSYTVTVEEEAIINITAEVEGPGATVSGTGTNGVTLGSSKDINITVTSQSGIDKEYTITVNNERPTAPVITGGSDDWTSTSRTISVSTEGTALSNVKEYEYYKTQSTTLPIDETEKTGAGNNVEIIDNGITYVYFRTVSNNNNRSAWSNAQIVKVDNNAPTNVVITASDNKASDTWHTANFTLSFSATKSGESNLTYYYGITNNPATPGSSVSISSNAASTTYYVKACNAAGVCSSNASYIVKLDKDTPAAPSITGGSTTWATSRTFILTNPTSTSGISKYEYYVSNSNTAPSASTNGTSILNPSFTVTQNGQYIFFRVVNNATTKGVWSNAYNLYVDTKAPSDVVITASDNKASGTWHKSNFTLSFSATQNGLSPVKYYYGTTTSPETLGSSVSISSNTASTTYYVKACNEADVCSSETYSASYIAKLDKTNPTVPVIQGGTDSSTWVATPRKISIKTASTALSGISKYEYYKTTSTTAPTSSTTATGTTSGNLTPNDTGTIYVYYRAVSNSGRNSSWSSAQIINRDNLNIYVSSFINAGSAVITDSRDYSSYLSPHNVYRNTTTTTASTIYDEVTNGNYDVVIINRAVWSLGTIGNSLYDAGYNLITISDDSSESDISIMASHNGKNSNGTISKNTTDLFTDKFSLSSTFDTSDNVCVKFISGSNVFYTETQSSGNVCDLMGAYSSNNVTWVHSTYGFGTGGNSTILKNYLNAALDYIVNEMHN